MAERTTVFGPEAGKRDDCARAEILLGEPGVIEAGWRTELEAPVRDGAIGIFHVDEDPAVRIDEA